MPTAKLAVIRRNLLRWYAKNQRDLPWRRSADPYAVWISETMLQQTQVKTVLPYYERFLAALPSIGSLAAAPIDKVLRLWSGLGYYRRAENLHKAARVIVRQHQGHLPNDLASLRQLPGIGDYTAGAVLSIAFGQRYPAIDGNVRRLFGRLFAVESETQVRAFAAQMLKAGNPADVNQALMELGATICTPRQPSCLICPAAQQCAARKAAPNQRPKPAVKKQVREVRWPLAILQRRGKILLRRRAGDGLLANLWELPGCETASTANHTALLQRELAALRIADMRPARLGEFRHSITDRRIRAAVYLFDTTLRAPLPDHRWRWIDARKLQDQPVSAMTRKAIKLYLDHETPAAQ